MKIFFIILFFSYYLITFSFAASVEKLSLISKTGLAATTVTGSKKVLEINQQDFVGVLTIDNYVAGTITATIQYSPDGDNWVDVKSFDAMTADGVNIKEISSFMLPSVRAVISNTATDSDVSVDLLFDRRK